MSKNPFPNPPWGMDNGHVKNWKAIYASTLSIREKPSDLKFTKGSLEFPRIHIRFTSPLAYAVAQHFRSLSSTAVNTPASKDRGPAEHPPDPAMHHCPHGPNKSNTGTVTHIHPTHWPGDQILCVQNQSNVNYKDLREKITNSSVNLTEKGWIFTYKGVKFTVFKMCKFLQIRV